MTGPRTRCWAVPGHDRRVREGAIIERTRRGKAHRARAGVVNVLSGASYGYRDVRKSDHASIADLARWLTQQQIPTRTGKARWDRSTVWGMLRNPAYAAGPRSPRPCAPSSGRG